MVVWSINHDKFASTNLTWHHLKKNVMWIIFVCFSNPQKNILIEMVGDVCPHPGAAQNLDHYLAWGEVAWWWLPVSRSGVTRNWFSDVFILTKLKEFIFKKKLRRTKEPKRENWRTKQKKFKNQKKNLVLSKRNN